MRQSLLADVASGAPWFAIPTLPEDTPRRAAVVGAGIAGTSIARALAIRGWSVTLIERHDAPAREASGNSAGIVMPLAEAAPSLRQRWYAVGYQYTLRCLARPGKAVEWSPCGVLLVAWNEREQRRQKTLLERSLFTPETVFPVDAREGSRRCGLPVAKPGLFFPAGGWLNPPSLCRAQVDAAGRGVSTLYHSEVFALQWVADGWSLCDEKGHELARVPVVVIATGKDAAGLTQTRGLPITRIRGQVTEFNATPDSRRLRTVVCGPGYALPARLDTHCIGATFEPWNKHCGVLAADHEKNRATLRRFFPAFAQLLAAVPASGRAAFRAGCPDHLPLLGPVPQEQLFRAVYAGLRYGRRRASYPPAPCYPGLYISAGYGARGLVSAPLAGELLARMICNEPPNVPLDLVRAVHPARFWVREIKRWRRSRADGLSRTLHL